MSPATCMYIIDQVKLNTLPAFTAYGQSLAIGTNWLISNRLFCLLIYREERSLRHVDMVTKFLNLNKPWSCKYGRKKKIEMYDFSVHDCTQRDNGSPHFSFIVRKCKWQSLSTKNVEIQKFCSHGNLTAHFSSLLNTLVKEVDGKERKRAISFPSSLSPRCRSSLLRRFCNRLRERQETTEDESAGTNECNDVTFRLLNKKINLVPVNLCVLF